MSLTSNVVPGYLVCCISINRLPQHRRSVYLFFPVSYTGVTWTSYVSGCHTFIYLARGLFLFLFLFVSLCFARRSHVRWLYSFTFFLVPCLPLLSSLECAYHGTAFLKHARYFIYTRIPGIVLRLCRVPTINSTSNSIALPFYSCIYTGIDKLLFVCLLQ